MLIQTFVPSLRVFYISQLPVNQSVRAETTEDVRPTDTQSGYPVRFDWLPTSSVEMKQKSINAGWLTAKTNAKKENRVCRVLGRRLDD